LDSFISRLVGFFLRFWLLIFSGIWFLILGLLMALSILIWPIMIIVVPINIYFYLRSYKPYLDTSPLTHQQWGRLDLSLSRSLSKKIGEDTPIKQIWQVINSKEYIADIGFFLWRLATPPQVIDQVLDSYPIDRDQVYKTAISLSQQFDQPRISPITLLASIFYSSPALKAYLENIGLKEQDIRSILAWRFRLNAKREAFKQKVAFGGIARDWSSGYTPLLDRYSHNISSMVMNYRGHYSVLGREATIKQSIDVLAKPSRASVTLVGQGGVGKTSIVYGIAQELLMGNSQKLEYYQINELDATTILGAVDQFGTSGIEQMIEALAVEAIKSKNMILFLDNAQLFLQAGVGSVDLSNLLLTILEKSPLKLIMTIGSIDWQRLQAAKPNLTGLMNPLQVEPTDQATTMQVLEDITIAHENREGAIVTYPALKEVYHLADQFITSKAFPAKAVDLLDQSFAFSQDSAGVKLVTDQVIAKTLEAKTNIKVTRATQIESKELLNLEDKIHQRMINQSRAVKVVSNALRRARAGVRNSSRPVGSFLFLGPTGVGKTELARSLAAVYYGGEDNMIRVDMSEYQRVEDIARLLGSVSESGSFLTAAKEKPFSVVLFDEIEKAHPDLLNLMLQLLDEGNLTDLNGLKVSFREAIVILTSNAGAEEIRARIEAGQNLEDFESQLVDRLIASNVFRPEFLNRFDEIVLFRPLNIQEIVQVGKIMLNSINAGLANQNIFVDLTDNAWSYVAEKGYDPRLGSRPMRRALQRYVQDLVAQKILSGQAQAGTRIMLDYADLIAIDS
ncbi:ATP-dependent Clp protease ATP-binding subunit, partial [Candidatus Saccharibacteria bacterium]|nr:ATP-dependent Clp protease ATP-binding subunit [Candidatus Saccharibacteria bacterium]